MSHAGRGEGNGYGEYLGILMIALAFYGVLRLGVWLWGLFR